MFIRLCFMFIYTVVDFPQFQPKQLSQLKQYGFQAEYTA